MTISIGSWPTPRRRTCATQDATLDLVTKHLLQDQLNYFAKRGKRHEGAAEHWLRLAAFATGVASVGVAAGGMVGAVGGPWLLAVAALGTIGTAVVSFATSQESIGQERERAQRFRNDVDALELVARQIDDVRGAIGRGSAEALVTFTAAINQQLALELGRFLEGGDSIRASITKLSQQIEKSREGKQDAAPKSPGPTDHEMVQGNKTGRCGCGLLSEQAGCRFMRRCGDLKFGQLFARERRCQCNGGSSPHGARRPLAGDELGRKGVPVRQTGRASLLVDLPRDEMALGIGDPMGSE